MWSIEALREGTSKKFQRPWPSHVQVNHLVNVCIASANKAENSLARHGQVTANTNTKHHRPSRAKPFAWQACRNATRNVQLSINVE